MTYRNQTDLKWANLREGLKEDPEESTMIEELH